MTSKEYYRMRRENHQCVACGHTDENTLSGKSRCVRCAEINKQELKSRKELYKKLGRCVQCGKTLPDDCTTRYCKQCINKHSEINREAKERQAMKIHDATEQAYKNGFKDGFKAGQEQAIKDGYAKEIKTEGSK